MIVRLQVCSNAQVGYSFTDVTVHDDLLNMLPSYKERIAYIKSVIGVHLEAAIQRHDQEMAKAN